MTRHTQTHQKVAETLAYCWSHCDTTAEEDAFLWIAEKLAQALDDVYRFEDHREGVQRVHVLDGPRKTFGSYPLLGAAV